VGKIKWTDKAIFHLNALHQYIAKDSLLYATRFIKSLIVSTEKLETLPRMGRIVPELKELKLREIIFKNYRIVYRIADNDFVEILAVIHASREIDKAFYNQ
jgi:toxin ParE1/3/4